MLAKMDPFRDLRTFEASFDKGVLKVSVPKTEQAKPRTIEVRSS